MKTLVRSCDHCQCYRQVIVIVEGQRQDMGDLCPICRSPMGKVRLSVRATPRHVTRTRLKVLTGGREPELDGYKVPIA